MYSTNIQSVTGERLTKWERCVTCMCLCLCIRVHVYIYVCVCFCHFEKKAVGDEVTECFRGGWDWSTANTYIQVTWEGDEHIIMSKNEFKYSVGSRYCPISWRSYLSRRVSSLSRLLDTTRAENIWVHFKCKGGLITSCAVDNGTYIQGMLRYTRTYVLIFLSPTVCVWERDLLLSLVQLCVSFHFIWEQLHL